MSERVFASRESLDSALANEIAWRTLSTDDWVTFKVFGLTAISLVFTDSPTQNAVTELSSLSPTMYILATATESNHNQPSPTTSTGTLINLTVATSSTLIVSDTSNKDTMIMGIDKMLLLVLLLFMVLILVIMLAFCVHRSWSKFHKEVQDRMQRDDQKYVPAKDRQGFNFNHTGHPSFHISSGKYSIYCSKFRVTCKTT